MTWPLKMFSLVLILTAAPALAFGPPSHYSAEAIEATIIDADTKKPIEGVIVVAHWQLHHGTVGGRVPAGQLEVLETVTDKDGKFRFPAWGPKPRTKGYLDDSDPALILFKPGYEFRGLQNPILSTTDHNPVRKSMWNGKVIEIRRFTGTPKERLQMLERAIPPYDRREDAKRSLMLRAILSEEVSIPDSIERKHLFFDNIVRRQLEGK